MAIVGSSYNSNLSASSLSIRMWCSCGKEDIEKLKLSSASSSLGKYTKRKYSLNRFAISVGALAQSH